MDDATEVEKPLPLRALLTRDVVIAAGNYASLSLVDIAFRAIHPVFLSTPIALGGLGLAPPTIGNLLSIYGVLNGVIQVFFFAQLNDRFGSKRVFMCGIASALPLFATFPLVNSLAREYGYSTLVYAVVVLQIANSVAVSMAYGTPFLRCVHSSVPCRTLADYAALVRPQVPSSSLSRTPRRTAPRLVRRTGSARCVACPSHMSLRSC